MQQTKLQPTPEVRKAESSLIDRIKKLLQIITLTFSILRKILIFHLYEESK